MSELDRLRSAALSPFDINVLKTAVEAGGEFPLYPDRLKPETRDVVVAGMNSLLARGILEIDEARSAPGRCVLRMTDHGRASYAQLEKMTVKPVEVQMQSATSVAGGGTE